MMLKWKKYIWRNTLEENINEQKDKWKNTEDRQEQRIRNILHWAAWDAMVGILASTIVYNGIQL